MHSKKILIDILTSMIFLLQTSKSIYLLIFLGLIKLIDEDIENFMKEESSNKEKLESIDTNITKIVPIMTSCMMMTKPGAAEDYFNNILKAFYSESERKYCMEQVESWFTDLTQNSDMAKELGFMELLDTLLSDDAYRQGLLYRWTEHSADFLLFSTGGGKKAPQITPQG